MDFFSTLALYPDLGLLLLRIALGVPMIMHSMTKWKQGIPAWSGTVAMPPVVGYGVATFELVGGLLVLTGFWPEIGAALIALVLLGALYKHLFVWKQKYMQWELAMILLLLAITEMILGPGSYALILS